MSDLASMSHLTVRELLATHEAVLANLRSLGVVRTNDAPAGQYAEWLAQHVFGGELAANSARSHDLMTSAGVRMQVKCRVQRTGRTNQRQLSPFRSFDFDEALIILFDCAYDVERATLLSAEQTKQLSQWRSHVNGYVLIARDSTLDLGTDVTAKLRSAHEVVPAVSPARDVPIGEAG